ncbi:hypothetical protein N656DRAFT_137721 [Canariomyces notabilis]|uniref:Uncharacterized protein n=1 Tax=Canariomyces notabilis TaxID=2074819 RepID=A0AAN6TBZ1_9PEZI|nr:hypothetical protein N656DRAFT_137721 [Canariomyces arenarius]
MCFISPLLGLARSGSQLGKLQGKAAGICPSCLAGIDFHTTVAMEVGRGSRRCTGNTAHAGAAGVLISICSLRQVLCTVQLLFVLR